jgi:hypothetical protein
MVESDANQSPWSNSLDHQGKYREFLGLSSVRPILAARNVGLLTFSIKFPGSGNREFSIVDQERQYPDTFPNRHLFGPFNEHCGRAQRVERRGAKTVSLH